MKDDFKLDHNRVTIFNKIDHIGLRKIYNSCSMLLCPSREETLHLAGIEAAACNLPIVATDVGIYKGLNSGMWGEKVKDLDFLGSIERVMKSNYSPRDYFLSMKLNKESCKEAWRRVINEQ
jgi:glycosyltransferase involved in cell wall biosynthesis